MRFIWQEFKPMNGNVLANGGGDGGHGGFEGGGHGGFDRGYDRGFDRGLDRGAWDAGGSYYYNNPGYGGYGDYNNPGYYYNQGTNPADSDIDQIYEQNQRTMEQGR